MKKINPGILIIILLLMFSLVFYFLPIQQLSRSSSDKLIKNPHVLVDSDTIKIATMKTDKPLNPLNDGGEKISLLSRLINTSLFKQSEDTEMEKDLVDKYWYDEGGSVISMILKKDHKFANGKEIKAHHVKNTYRVLADPEYSGTYSSYVDNLKGYYPYKLGQDSYLEAIEIVDDNFIRFHFNVIDFSNINALTFPILDIEDDDFKYGDVSDLLEKDYINGGGRYEVVDFSNAKVKLKLKEEDRNKNIKLKELEVLNLHPLEVLENYKKGQVDIVYKYHKTNTFNKSLFINDRINDYSYSIDHESEVYHFLGFNEESKIFSQAEYRKALRDSINIEEIVESIFGQGIYDHPHIPVYKNSWFYQGTKAHEQGKNLKTLIEEDIAKGKLNIDEKIKLKLIVSDNNDFFRSIEDRFVQNLENEYIDIEVDYLSSQEMYKALNGEVDFDFFIGQRYMTDIPNQVLEDSYPVEGYYSLLNLADKGFHYYLEQIKNNVNDPEVIRIKETWKYNFDEISPYVVLATEKMTTVINNRIKGIYLNEFIGLDYIKNLENIEVKTE